MDRLEAMSIFLAVVDEGSLAAAARRLGFSPAKVTRAVAHLEEISGERLLERSTRRVAISEAGIRHAGTYRSVLSELAELEARARNTTITGNVVVTAPELFGRLKVMPVVHTFLAAHPHTGLRLLLLNRMVDLVGEGVDVAIRLAKLADSSLVATKVGEVRRLTCAAPSYLAEHSKPRQPGDLVEHSCIGLNAGAEHALWPYRDPAAGGRLRSVRVSSRLGTNSVATAIDAAVRGLGIVRPLSYQVQRELAEGSLVCLLEAYEPEPVPVNLVFMPQRGRHGGAVRAFIDHAVPQLRQMLGHPA